MIQKRVCFILLYLYFFSGVCTSIEERNNHIHRGQRFSRSEDGLFCTLPPYPENGKWTLLGGDAEPGQRVKISSVLTFQCEKGYRLTSESQYVVCDLKWDSIKLPQCEKLCPLLYSTTTTILKCSDGNGKNISCNEATAGSVLTYKCAPFYEVPTGFRKSIYCNRGNWNYPKPICQPVCGRKANDETIPLVSGGQVQEELKYPWIVALYHRIGDRYENKCGGSLISERIVLTAAHCVTDDNNELLPKEIFRIGVGKLYINYNDVRDLRAQYLDLSRIMIHASYKGDIRRFLGDIAILVTKNSFKITRWVQPICFNNVNSMELHAGDITEVSGWGVKEDGLVSEELRTLKIPYKNATTCNEELPKEWADKYHMIDKICAGFYKQNRSVCRGDSGNGLVFLNPADRRYYIHGIVSLGHAINGECDIQQNSLYTSVTFYYKFIDEEVYKYNIEDCELPPYPLNGRWISEEERIPGESAPSDTILNISCNQGYTLSSDVSDVQCQEAMFNMPTCQRLCSHISSPGSPFFNCNNEKGESVNCSQVTDNHILTYTCPNGTTGISKCVNGSWSAPIPECQQSDSKQYKRASTRVICNYASWEAYNGVNPEDLDASLCDVIVYAYVGLYPDGKLRVQDDYLDTGTNTRGLYYRVTDMKKINSNLKVLLSVGGSKASNYSLFSSLAADSLKRLNFIKSAKDFLQTYNFDGIDIEWNIPNAEDKSNYILLLREVKQALKEHGWLLAASVNSNPEDTGYDGIQMNEILDWITVKTYNMYGDWSHYTGQNSALYPSSLEYEWEKKHLNMDSSSKNWIATGVTKNKLVLSIAFYGRSFTLQSKSNHGIHAPIQGSGPGKGGMLKYSEICEKYAHWNRQWDAEQRNPYIYSDDKWVGYDDKESVWIKAAYIKENGYLGVNVWPVDGDDIHGKCGPKQILLKQVHSALRTDIR